MRPQSEDDRLAGQLAREAASLLLSLRGGSLTGRELGAAGDRRSNELIVGGLKAERPKDAILSEESLDDVARLKAKRVWIVDPLDGTREYSEAARTDWAIHIALWDEGVLTASVVALPAQDTMLEAWKPPMLSSPRRPPRMVVSRSRPPEIAEPVARALEAEIVSLGSAGAKTAAVITGQAEIYLHAGGQYEWDSAAPSGVARASGLHASRIDGSPLLYNQPDVAMPDLLICRPELAEPTLAALAAQVSA